LALLSAAALVLRRAARDMTASGRPESDLPEMAIFAGAAQALATDDADGDRIIPIAQLFHTDAGPHVVAAAVSPPTTAAQRFRLEVVSLAEHLRRIVAEARAPRAPEHGERIVRELRHALRALEGAALSFEESAVAHFAAAWSTHASLLDEHSLGTLDAAAALLTDPARRGEELTRALAQLATPGAQPAQLAPPPAPAQANEAPPAASTEPATPRAPIRTPTGRELLEYLQSGLAGFRELERAPLTAPTPIPDDEIIPIERILYRGPLAVKRAAELRAEFQRHDGALPREVAEELFDLVALAHTE
jgi:hypothetical protein